MLDLLLDPGHGGHMPTGGSTPYGSRAHDGRLEKDLNLQIARAVQGELRGRSQLTRIDDRNVRLGARAEHARQLGARSFVSVHSDLARPESTVWVHEDAGADSHALADAVCGRLNAYGAAARIERAPMTVLDPGLLGHSRPGCMVELGTRALARPREAASAIAQGVSGWLATQPRARWGAPARISENDHDPNIYLQWRYADGTQADPSTHRIVVAAAGDLSVGINLEIVASDISRVKVQVEVVSTAGSTENVLLRDYVDVEQGTPLLWGRSVPVPVGPITIRIRLDQSDGTAPNGPAIVEGRLTL